MAYLTDRQIGWLAGVIDADGCINISERSRGNGTYHTSMRVVVGMTCKEAIYRIKKLAGCGSISLHPGRNNGKDQWHWVASGVEAIFVLKIIKDDLFIKREQLLLALEFEKCVSWHKTKLTEAQKSLAADLLRKIQILNKKGKQVDSI